ncbi:restriction endonuclease [Corynebacterium bovis]|uniref:restriction endonuclease n=1 Tax=Corynebacterium bovis TaxID=36808 RepID=UPI003138FC96
MPTIDEFRPVVLRVLSDGKERHFRDVVDRVARHLNLSPDERAEKTPSGSDRYVNRLTWACSGLTFAGLLERTKRGHYRITENGLIVHRRGLATYSEKDMWEWSAWQAYSGEVAARRAGAPVVSDVVVPKDVDDADPIEVMHGAEYDFNSQTETALRKRLQESSPEFFEKAVIELLWAMGYGGPHGEKQHVGRSGDGGIDGVIRQDALGLSTIYIQAKRYADGNRIGGPEMRNFIGSLVNNDGNLGVFITTSTFLPAAETAAAGYPHGTIILIDGLKLTSLMLDYGVAVNTARQFTLYEIDDDFFEDGTA